MMNEETGTVTRVLLTYPAAVVVVVVVVVCACR